MATANTRRTDDIAPNELYSTPIEAMIPFIKEVIPTVGVKQDTVFYDPCDGLQGISGPLLDAGFKVYCSDIELYGIKRHDSYWVGERDFLGLQQQDVPEEVDYLIFNPPFKLTEQFIDKAESLGKPFFMFNRLTTLESISRARKFKYEWSLQDVWVFGNRVSCDKGVEREPTANAVAYAWFYFNGKANPYNGAPRLHWLVK